MTEGGIASWKKQAGESYSAGDVLLEIETDKATMDVEAQDDGVLAKIIVGDGNKAIPIGTPIAILGEEGDDLSGADALAEQASSEKPAEQSAEKSEEKPAEKPAEKSEPAPATQSKESSAEPQGPRQTIAATPIARKLALERGVPLKELKGTGPDGRITKQDVEKYKSAAPQKQSSAPAAATYEDIPVSNMRKVIGQRLSESKSQTPHYYVTSEVDLSKLLKLRSVFNNAAESEKRAKLSVNDFILKAVAIALKQVPEANQAWLGENIRQYHQADISVAVATPSGLITPIIKNAGAKGLAEISAETKALAVKARDGKLKPEEYQGGTFTISNLGMFGVDSFTAIINPPQSCILAVGASSPKLVLDNTTEKGFREIQALKLTLSSDHRVVDGAIAARFLAALNKVLADPLSLML
ncbi:pyruvate dehydrogenase [Wallemia mellicola]|uniref:Acetyltransferase component of pyruvate dehydrogenase complex n=1 Tax=Wallemia mellicola TaxID=1708541 RepID=A0A4T0NZJ8_9BASI|nr:hypothetical protein E3Q23_01496 [Wallemia mellicola]TIB80665.1 pyruvate dehydrogenase [Wallemia mellicola]TIB85682.1 pyruvate dehydrogenase [Wallemia mellicola]TIB88866.1 pyruvate dehydrogenase [Wallemia mellicola]TIC02027.1 pyruvate dehydrogenase [Wallemia mellicola]